jgi:acyl-CoA dehydrogenase
MLGKSPGDRAGQSSETGAREEAPMDFELPQELNDYLAELDAFIEAEIRPLERADDNIRFFDHRREWARTDFDNGGLPRKEWEDLLREAKRRADRAGYFRFAMPEDVGGRNGSNLWMAVIREHLAAKGLGLHNDLQNEHSIVGNNPFVLMFRDFGTPAQQEEFVEGMLEGRRIITFGLTEPEHGSDATHMETRALPETRDGVSGWRIDGEKMWTTGMHVATHCALFARTAGKDGDAAGITCFLVPADAQGVKIEEYLWTFNMPTDHPRVSFTNVWVPESAVFGPVGGGLALAQHFVHENRIRQAASSLGAATYCIEEAVRYARARKPFGKPLSENQAIQFPLVELHTQCEMLRQLIRKTAWEMDRMSKPEVEKKLSDKVSMCNYWANRLVCEAADRAMQVHGGIGYSRHKPFEHIYRHHRRYRITEGSEEIQMRKVAAWLFGYLGTRREQLREEEVSRAAAE